MNNTKYYLILIYFISIQYVYARPIVILVLGSHMQNILRDRMETAIKFADSQSDNVKITWFLSGGIKHELNRMSSNTSEANKMANWLVGKKNWNIELDTKATNTAENFAFFRKWIETQPSSDVYIITSAFHFDRALEMVNNILVNNSYNWLLGSLSYVGCKVDEQLHSKNIKSDIIKANTIYNEL